MNIKLGSVYYCTKKRRFGECFKNMGPVIKLRDRATGDRWTTRAELLAPCRPPGVAYLDEDVKCCNCVLCNRVLVSPIHANRANRVPIVAGRVADRPYCAECIPFAKEQVA